MDNVFSLLAIVWIDVVLSSDNALIIAMACRALPDQQRRLAIILGATAAALLRIVFTLLFFRLLFVPYVKVAGGLVVLWISARLVGKNKGEIGPSPESIWGAIRIIVVADAIMSLDNIIAIAGAAQGSWPLIVFGLSLSIPLIVFGSTILARLLDRFPILVWIGAGILGWVAGELVGSDLATAQLLAAHGVAIALWIFGAAGVAFALAGSWLRLRVNPSASL